MWKIRRIWKKILKFVLQNIDSEGVNWVNVCQDRDKLEIKLWAP